MPGRARTVAVLRDTPGEYLDIFELQDNLGRVTLRMEHTIISQRYGVHIDLSKSELIALLKASLTYLDVDRKIAEAVLPRLTKENIVR